MAFSSKPSPSSKAAELDPPLANVGFEYDIVAGDKVNGRFIVTQSCCQPFKVLHGGVSAMISEGLASMGAHIASGYRRIAGIQMSINHHRSSKLGEMVFAEATPIQVGRTIQVWQVHLWKMDQSTAQKGDLVSSSRVTFLSNMPIPENAKDSAEKLKKYAKL